MNNEQHFQRDSWLSQRHRSWGMNVPAMDIDFLLIEYDRCVPVALIDYKNEKSTINFNSASVSTLRKLGDMAGIPAYIVVYGHDYYENNALWSEPAADATHWFTVVPLNVKASKSNRNMNRMNEHEYVSFLYELRNRPVPAIISSIKTSKS